MKIRLNPVVVDTQYALFVLSQYLDTMEAQLLQSQASERAKFTEQIAQENLVDDVDVQSALQDHYQFFEKDFPSRLRYSFVVLLYIVLETQSRALCRHLASKTCSDKTLNDMQGHNLLDRLKTFLKDVRGIRLAESDFWVGLHDIRKIRDCIVHGNGNPSELKKQKDRDHIARYAMRGKGITTDSWSFLKIEKQFCQSALKVVEEFFTEVFEACGFEPERQGEVLKQ